MDLPFPELLITCHQINVQTPRKPVKSTCKYQALKKIPLVKIENRAAETAHKVVFGGLVR